MATSNKPGLPTAGREIMSEDPGSLAQRLKRARKMQRLTQQQLADRTGYYSQKGIAKIESGGTKQPEWDGLMALADSLDVKPAWLQYGKAVLDNLDEAALEIAALTMQMTPEQRRTYLETLRAFVGETKKPASGE